ncbi:hypothetical protein ACLQ2O_26370, partial [Kribbella sp. DT2]
QQQAHDRVPDPSTRLDRPAPHDARPMHDQPAPPRNPGDIESRLHPDGPPAPRAPRAPHDPNRIDNRLHPDGPPAPRAPHDPNRIDDRLHPDGPPAPRAPHDPNRIDNRLHPDGPPAPRDPNRIDDGLNPDGPPAPRDPNRIDDRLNPDRPPVRDPREDFMQRPPRDPREDFMQRPETPPRDPRLDYRQDGPGDGPAPAGGHDGPAPAGGHDGPQQGPDRGNGPDPHEPVAGGSHDTGSSGPDQRHGDHDPFADDRMDPQPAEDGEFIEGAQDAEDLAAQKVYQRARVATDDVPKVADEIGVDPDIVQVAKDNLFTNRNQVVAVAPGVVREGYFTPLGQVADLWKKVMNGTPLKPGETNALRGLIAHEYVEAKLMESGVPYNSPQPGAWKNGRYDDSREAARAHTVAPRPLQEWAEADLLKHWKKIGITPPPGGLAADLSNLDDIVRAAREGMGW